MVLITLIAIYCLSSWFNERYIVSGVFNNYLGCWDRRGKGFSMSWQTSFVKDKLSVFLNHFNIRINESNANRIQAWATREHRGTWIPITYIKDTI